MHSLSSSCTLGFAVLRYLQAGDLFHHLRRARRERKEAAAANAAAAAARGLPPPTGVLHHTFGGLGVERARFYGAEVACAIAHLHSLNIAYRDLKPSNVMLDHRGHVRLVDFGLCKREVLAGANASARTFVGTGMYVAPEVITTSAANKRAQQLRNSGGGGGGHGRYSYGHACDWWSLGIVLYELLVGETPFYHADTRLMFAAIIHKPAERYIERHSALLGDAAPLLRGLLEKNPRYRLGAVQEEEERTAARGSAPKGARHGPFNSSGKVPPALRRLGIWAPLAPHWHLLERGLLPPPWLPAHGGRSGGGSERGEHTNVAAADLSLGYVDSEFADVTHSQVRECCP